VQSGSGLFKGGGNIRGRATDGLEKKKKGGEGGGLLNAGVKTDPGAREPAGKREEA